MTWGLREWVDSIDVGGDGKKDTKEYQNIKDILLKDAEFLWGQFQAKKIDKIEYDTYLLKLRKILQKHYSSVQEAYNRYNQEQKIIFQETENKSTGLAKIIRNVKTEGTVFAERFLTEDLLHWYTTAAGNYTIPVKVFEEKLKMDSFKDVNTKEITSYLEYLLKKGKLNKETIEEKFWKDNMMEFMRIWSTKIQKFDIKSRNINDTTFAKELGEYFLGNTDEVEEVLAKIFQEKLEKDNIQVAQKIYHDAQNSKHPFFKRWKNKQGEKESIKKYTIFIDKAYNAFKKEGEKRDDFQKKFEKLLKNGFSTYDICYELLGDTVKIGEFKKIIAEVSKIEKKEEQDIGQEIQEHIAKNLSCYGKNFCALPRDEQLVIAKKQNDHELVQLLKEQDIHKKNSKRTEKVAEESPRGNNALALLLKTKQQGLPIDQANKGIDMIIKVDESTNILNTSENITFVQSLPGFENVTDLSKKDVAEKLIPYLETKSSKTKEETSLLTALNKLTVLRKEEKRETVKIAMGITDDAIYDKLEKEGKIPDSIFAGDLLESINPGMTMAQLGKKLNKAIDNKTFAFIENHTEKNDITTKLATLSDNEKIPLQEIGGDTCFVEKNGNGYTLSINGDKKDCSSKEGVKNTLDAYNLFHRLGLKSIIPHMDVFLATVRESSPICPKFNTEEEFSPEKQLFLSSIVNKIFHLDMEKIIAWGGTETILSDFETRLSRIDQKARLKDREVLTAQGDFHKEGLKQVLMAERGVL